MIVTIDGPAGAGKSSAARELARRLGFRFLDTGAMYRAVAFNGLRRGIDLTDEAALERVARDAKIEIGDNYVRLDGEEVTRDIRTVEVTAATGHAAANVGVRRLLVELQRRHTAGGDFVTEGRDQGTVVFPDAECKIFLTATPAERARRRREDLAARGQQLSLEEVLEAQNRRDHDDAAREVGPLRRADDAVEVVTDGMSPKEVVDCLEALVRARMPSGE